MTCGGREGAAKIEVLAATQRQWLVALRDKTGVKEDDPIPAGGFYWAVNLAGPFLPGR